MELDIKTKTTWILAGRIALGAVCMLVTVLSLSRLGSDEWRTLVLCPMTPKGMTMKLSFVFLAYIFCVLRQVLYRNHNPHKDFNHEARQPHIVSAKSLFHFFLYYLG